MNPRIEHQLIIHCARTRLSPERMDCVRDLLSQEIDWPYLTTLLTRNRVTPLFCNAVMGIPETHIEERVRASFKSYFQMTMRRNLQLKGELQGILTIFEANGIAGVPFKGPVLAETVYGNLALREFDDLDILVHHADFLHAKELLLGLKYQPTVISEETFERNPCHEIFTHTTSDTFVELHWQLAVAWRSFLQERNVPWDYLVQVALGDLKVQVFQPEFQLIYLCFHGYKHHWERLCWIVDVAELINRVPNLDWQAIHNLAAQLHMTEIVDMGVLLAYNMLGCELSDSVIQRVEAKSKLRAFEPYITKQLFPSQDDLVTGKVYDAENHALQYALLTTARHKRQYLYHRFVGSIKWTPNAEDRAWVHLPPRLDGLYSVVRPIRLAYKYGLQHLKSLVKVLMGR